MRLDELPPEIRRAIQRGDVHAPSERTKTRTTARARWTFRCHRCSERFASWAAAERHEHGWIELEL